MLVDDIEIFLNKKNKAIFEDKKSFLSYKTNAS